MLTEIQPQNFVGAAPAVLTPPIHKRFQFLHGGNYFQAFGVRGGPLHIIDLERHSLRWRHTTLPYWVGTEQRTDQHGKEWFCHINCVTDDHGWLVEVPEC